MAMTNEEWAEYQRRGLHLRPEQRTEQHLAYAEASGGIQDMSPSDVAGGLGGLDEGAAGRDRRPSDRRHCTLTLQHAA
jgi:hypothetical protein